MEVRQTATPHVCHEMMTDEGLQEETSLADSSFQLGVSDHHATLPISNKQALPRSPAADVDSVFPKKMPLTRRACMIYAGSFTAARRGNKLGRIFCV